MAIISGTRGADTLSGGNASDVIFALAGRDTAWGGGGNDYVSGGSGVDRLYGDDGDDVLEGGEHDDILKAGDGDDLLRGGRGADQLDGGSDDDTVRGDEGSDRLSGGDGDDLLRGDAGNDHIDGGDGTDTAQFRGDAAGYRITRNDDGTVTVADIRLRDGWDGVDTLEGVERLRFADRVVEIAPSLDLDLVIAVVVRNSPNLLFLNEGGVQLGNAGDFASGTPLSPAAGNEAADVALGDLDGDGDLDILLGSRAAPLRTLVNQGGLQGGSEGTFVAVDLAGATDDYAFDVALGDLDGDGDLDALTAGQYADDNQLLLNQGGDQLGAPGDLLASRLSGALGTAAVAIGDLDGDGDLDAFLANDGVFGGADDKVVINQGFQQGGDEGDFTLEDVAGSPGYTTDVALGDLDGDGDLDAMLARRVGYESLILINQGRDQEGTEGEFVAGVVPGGAQNVVSVALGDLDGDGDLDAVLGVPYDGSRILVNQGGAQAGVEGTFVFDPELVPGTVSSNVEAIYVGDVDGDQDLDLFVNANTSPPNSRFILNQGGIQGGTEGAFALGDTLDTTPGTLGAALGDLDGDGLRVLTPGGLPYLGHGLSYAADLGWVA
ncbi:MAG: calcium-binding protein [Geminicoccaceae bacterium]